MKKFVFALLALIVLLSACGQPAPVLVVDDVTATPSLTPTSTATHTASITPLPTIPTFTPTFDVSTIVTVTPAVKEDCPKGTLYNENFLPQPVEIGYPANDIIQPILNFLNSGGDINRLDEVLEQYYEAFSPEVILTDVTNDGNPELILNGVITANNLYYQNYILSCNNGQFVNLSIMRYFGRSDPSFPCCITFIEDLNADNIPEIITDIGSVNGGVTFAVYAWNGSRITLITEFGTSTFTDETIENVNHSGLKKLVVISKEGEEFFKYLDQTVRDRIITLLWNGEEFLVLENYSAPRFRFQVIQDADARVNNGDIQEAISLYQDAIFSDTLDWWSFERFAQQSQANNWGAEATPLSVAPDTTERPRLAAYAYYRIMLLRLAQGQESEAITTYQTLQEKFGDDPYAHPYVEMASAFWEAHQSAHRMYDGCAAAIQYAVEHPEILIPLGSDYHGAQSHIYVPEDVCPFR